MNTSELAPVCRSRVKTFSIFVIVAAMLGILTNSNVASADSNEAPADSLNQPVQSSIALGATHSCAIDGSGAVKCWGNNANGQLGDDQGGTNSATPVSVVNLGGVAIALSAGNAFTCALLRGGSVKCWGDNSSGELGDGQGGAGRSSDVPVQVTGLTTDVVAISSGPFQSCAVLSGGIAKCWGSNSHGQLGNGSIASQVMSPVDVSVMNNISTIAPGQYHTCAIDKNDTTVWCWGLNDSGQLGNGTKRGSLTDNDYKQRNQVTGINNAVAVTTFNMGGCVILSDTTARCWGNNQYGTIGDGTTTERLSPVDVLESGTAATTPIKLMGVTAINTQNAAGSYWHYTCALLSDGTAKCWGYNRWGRLGTNNNLDAGGTNCSGFDYVNCIIPSPVTVADLGDKAFAITTGGNHTCAVLSQSIKCWGHNNFGQLGDGNSGQINGVDRHSATPIQIGGGITPVQPAPALEPDNNSSGNNTSGDNNATNNSGETTNNTLSPGQFNATVNGLPVSIDVTSTNEGQVIVNGSDFSLTFDSPTSGNNNALFLPLGGAVTFNGEGYKSNSQVTSTLTSTNTNVGNSKVSKNGSFSSRIIVPRGTRSGNHQLSVNGIARNGAPRNITLGVSVNSLKKRTVKLFGVYSSKLNKKIRKQTRRIVKEIPPLTAAHCQGFVAPNKISNPRYVKRAKQRARAVCRFIKKRNRAVHTTIGVAPTTQTRRQVLVSYR